MEKRQSSIRQDFLPKKESSFNKKANVGSVTLQQPERKQHLVLAKEGRTLRFYQDIKNALKKSDGLPIKSDVKSNTRRGADLEYYQNCVDNKIVALPLFTKIENKVFRLFDFYISPQIAMALEKWFKGTEECLEEVYLE